jgi:DNA modification methylase
VTGDNIETGETGVEQGLGFSAMDNYIWSYGNTGRAKSFFEYDGKNGFIYCTNSQNGL